MYFMSTERCGTDMSEQIFLAAASQGGSGRGYRHLQGTVCSAVSLPDFEQPVAVWGARQESSWSRMEAGDIVLFYTGDHRYEYAATVVGTGRSRERARELWSAEGSPGTDDGTGEWEYLIYLRDVREVDIDSETLHEWAGYGMDHLIRFQRLNERAHQEIRDRYGDVPSYIEAMATSDGILAAAWNQPQIDDPQAQASVDADEGVPDTRAAPRTETTISRIIRNSELVSELKALYDHRCQVCDQQRRRGDSSYYAEGHHLHPLGDGGPDEAANILVLCPNHHADFDYGTISVDPTSLEIRHLYEGEIDGRVLTVRGDHEVDSTYLRYHNEEISVPAIRV